MDIRIAYLGPKATFCDLAASKLFPYGQRQAFMTIPECMDAVEAKLVDYAVIPLENALEGSVNITLDYLIHEVPIPIVAEFSAPIRQHLMVHPSHVNELTRIDRIISHSHAIAQCHKFLHGDMKGVRCESITSTAAAAHYIQEHPDELTAAIANEMAAEEYGLSIVKWDIHDYSHNRTRFVILGHKPLSEKMIPIQQKGEKTTIMVLLPADHAGALHQVLSAFSWRKLNLSKIESRPLKTGLGNYFFIIDIEQKMDDILLPGAIAEMEALGCQVTVMGSYYSY